MQGVDELTGGGGLVRKRVELVIRDGVSDPLLFADGARELFESVGLTTIFGWRTSSSHKALKQRLAGSEPYHVVPAIDERTD